VTKTWKSALRTDPLAALIAWPDPALAFFVQRDLLNAPVGPIEALWELPQSRSLVVRQQADGSWRYPGRSVHPAANANYELLETYRSLRLLVEMYGFNREHPALVRAAEYVFSCQTAEGDIRGILGNQYMPYYHAAILELIIKAGYAKDKRTEKGLQWLLSMRQADGGWIIPAQLVPASLKTEQFWSASPLPPDRSRPHSHHATRMILRAFAAHPGYRQRPETLTAGARLKERFFLPDKYNDRQSASYWLKFQFPFWWPNLLTALDTLFWLKFDRQDPAVARALDWFLSNQSADGLWEIGYGSGSNIQSMCRWVGLAICRVLKRFFDEE
jgi:hypothetical protein